MIDGKLDALTARGFRPGLAPSRPRLGQMHELAKTMMDVFSAPDGPSVVNVSQ